MRNLPFAVILILAALPTGAKSQVPDLMGKWECDPAPILIRGEWTTLTYTFELSEQREGLFEATFHWALPKDKAVKGEKVTGERSFEGEWTGFGVVGWDNSTVEIVTYKDVARHTGRLEDANTLRFVHSKIGDDAWVSRSTCRRQN
jgi:hypothetical protein